MVNGATQFIVLQIIRGRKNKRGNTFDARCTTSPGRRRGEGESNDELEPHCCVRFVRQQCASDNAHNHRATETQVTCITNLKKNFTPISMTTTMTHSKKSGVACSVGKVCTYTLCTTSNTRKKTRRDEINTGCCWNKFSDFKSLESSDSVQRIEGGQGIQQGRQPDNRREACGRYRSSSVHPDRFPPFLSQDWWYAFSASVLVEIGHLHIAPGIEMCSHLNSYTLRVIHQFSMCQRGGDVGCLQHYKTQLLFAEGGEGDELEGRSTLPRADKNSPPSSQQNPFMKRGPAWRSREGRRHTTSKRGSERWRRGGW